MNPLKRVKQVLLNRAAPGLVLFSPFIAIPPFRLGVIIRNVGEQSSKEVGTKVPWGAGRGRRSVREVKSVIVGLWCLWWGSLLVFGKCIENSNGVGKDIKLIKVQNKYSSKINGNTAKKIEFPNLPALELA